MEAICVPCLLADYELFDGLQSEELDQLGKGSYPTFVPKRQYVFTPNEPSNAVYMLKMGRVRISRLSDTGKLFTLVILEPGDIFGESALFGDEPRKHFAEALDDAYICAIDKRQFEQLMIKNPAVSLKLARIVEQRLEDAQEQMENLVFHGVQSRLARLLLKLADMHGKFTANGVVIDLKLTHEDMASLIGSTRETTSKILSEFKAAGYLDVIRKQIVLLDQQALFHI
ncbi:MAG: hypothetical protein JWN30_783 [Bacilli bacterium]|nr:hypothetical protein [Bacilli bacterium]